ncbi:MAG: bifunctional glycosyltransferase family 2/GtrA family protein [Actinomycetes bacterium]
MPAPATERPSASAPQSAPAPPLVDIVLPVYNEESDLGRNVARLHEYLEGQSAFSFRITIADNASSDGTWAVACRLAESVPRVTALHLDEKGRGRALKAAWSRSDATVLAYMDIDLSTDLAALLPLVAPLVSGHSDLAIGTRLSRSAVVHRGPKREFISRSYNRLTRLALHCRFSDAQCGFKAIRADRARALLPWIEDDGWFFDTELLVVAERAGLRIHEVPVDWTDDPDSRVDIVPTAVADLKGIARLRHALAAGKLPLQSMGGRRAGGTRGASGIESGAADRARGRARLIRQLESFGLIGVASTLAYAALYLVLREAMPAQAANALSLLLTALANTAANRRLTFAVRGAGGRLRVQSQGLVVFVLGLAVTSGSLFLLRRFDPATSHAVELAVLIAASVIATLLRFVLFRVWIFPQRRAARPQTNEETPCPQ